MAFSGTTAYLELLKELAYNTSIEFEQICFEMLSDIFPDIRRTESLGLYDKSGFDLFTFKNTNGDFEMLFQCKGFQQEFGDQQLKQCLKSIKAFEKSSIIGDEFCFIINKRIKEQKYYDIIEQKLYELNSTNRIKNYRILDIHKFLTFLQQKYSELILNGIKKSSEYFHRQFISSLGSDSYVFNVPFTLNDQLYYNPLEHIINRSEKKSLAGKGERGKYIFVVSEFGFGKTTLLFNLYDKLLVKRNKTTIYIPLGALPPDALASEADVVRNILSLLIKSDHDNPLINKFKRGVFQNILKNQSDIVLLFDGIDEHKALRNIRGLKVFFNSLTTLKPMIVFTMRKEFWDDRQEDLQEAIGRRRYIQDKIILVDWNDFQILEYLNGLKQSLQKNEFVAAFKEIVSENRYKDIYGDIPKRPLFLQMIISDLISGADTRSKVSISLLYRKFIMQKIKRDLIGSSNGFVLDRGLSVDEGIFSFSEKVFNCLEEIAIEMIIVENQQLYSQNIVRNDNINSTIIKYGFKSLSDLMLHSVLVPAEERRDFVFNLKFAHFSFLEYFIARFILKNILKDSKWLDYTYEPSLFQFISNMILEDEFSDVYLYVKSLPNETNLIRYLINNKVFL